MWNAFVSQFRMLLAGIANREEGQTLVEYALIIALVSVALIAALGALTGNITGIFNAIGTALQGV